MRLAGYAALFNVPDGARDTIRPGAFAATLAARSEPLPLYWQHRPEQRIGWVEQACEVLQGHAKDLYARAYVMKMGRRLASVRAEAWQENRADPVSAIMAHFMVAQD